jgi:sulfur carrier protein ThiS
MTVLEIRISDNHEHFTIGGDITKLARAISKLGLHNEEFALALNFAVTGMNEELEAIRLRDEMIGFILNPEQK